MKYIALRDSYIGKKYYVRGEVYDFNEAPSRHFNPLSESKPEVAKPEPSSYSEFNKQADELEKEFATLRKPSSGKRGRNL
jgi:hypothetical protein